MWGADDDLPLPLPPSSSAIAMSRRTTADQLRPLFALPLKAAASRLGVSSKHLKRVCRRVGVMRWPYRKIQALFNMASDLRTRGASQEALGDLDAAVASLIDDPSTEVDITRLKNKHSASLEMQSPAAHGADGGADDDWPFEGLFQRMDACADDAWLLEACEEFWARRGWARH